MVQLKKWWIKYKYIGIQWRQSGLKSGSAHIMYICKYTITNLNWPVLICQGVLSWSSNKENCAMQEWIRWGFKSCCLLGLGRKVLGWWRGQVLPKWVCYSKLLHGKSLLWKNLHDVISLTYGVCRTFMVTFNQALHSWKLSPPSIRGVLLSLHAKVV